MNSQTRTTGGCKSRYTVLLFLFLTTVYLLLHPPVFCFKNLKKTWRIQQVDTTSEHFTFFQDTINLWCHSPTPYHWQGRREPNVGPGPAQMWRNCGFVKSKTDGENAADGKKKVFSEISTVFQAKIKLFACDFDGPFTSQCHLDGPPLELMGPLMGPLKSLGSGVIVPPAPLSEALTTGPFSNLQNA